MHRRSKSRKGSCRLHRMHRCDALLSSTQNAPDSLYRPSQPAVHPNRSQRSIFGRRPYPQCLRFSPKVVSSTCGVDMRPPFQVKRHEALPGLRTCHQVLYCLRLLLIHPLPRNLSAGQQANLNGQRHIARTCPTTPGHCPSPRILFCIDAAHDAQSIRKCFCPLAPPHHTASRVGHNALPPFRFALPTKSSLLLAQKPFSLFGGGTANAAPSIRVGSFSGRSLDCPQPAKNICNDENRRF